MSVLIETTIGDLVFDLYTDERPRSSLNFLKLCKIKYYNYCLFHSVRRNFIAQCGDPTGTGRGGESIYANIYGDQAKYFDLETKPRIKHKTKGTISFVNNGNDKHGSQFFITMGEGLDFLDGKHTIFGTLAEGFDILDKLNETICDDNHKPYQDVRITHTIILYDPFDDPKGLVIPDGSPEPTKEQLESCGIGADEDLEADKNKPIELINKELEEKELQIGTKILETVGDIRDTEEKPPENVLFVCKLNPVTNADDLKIIFSRFGKIRSCEIIKDFKTGDSLCYGFVEFKDVGACEKAYFKMDNVMIDDRRIHVDFCQSIAKLKKWHKSSGYQKKAKETTPPPKEAYAIKGEKGNNEKGKYAMVFEEEPQVVSKKDKKKSPRDPFKEKPRKKYESESEDDRSPVVKRVSEPKPKKMIKESRKRKHSYSSASEYEEKRPKEVKPKKKSEPVREKEKVDVKKKVRKEKLPESDLSSDEEREYVKKDKKKKFEEKAIERPKNEDTRIKKKTQKKESRKSKYSESEDEVEKTVINKAKKKKKTEEYYSESDEIDSNVHLKKSKKEKYPEKKRKRTNESDDEEEVRSNRSTSKQRSHSKKAKSNKSRARSVEDSDTEDYAEEKTPISNRKKQTKVSSNESSDNEQRKPSKTSRSSSTRRPVSSDDERPKKSHKKLSAKKKSRKRHDTSESDSSEYSR